jgi:hypothetical protein
MKVTIYAIGVVLILMGTFWMLHGLNIIPGGRLAGNNGTALAGEAIAVGGIVALVAGFRYKKRR